MAESPRDIHLAQSGHNIKNVVLIGICSGSFQHIYKCDMAALCSEEFTGLKAC